MPVRKGRRGEDYVWLLWVGWEVVKAEMNELPTDDGYKLFEKKRLGGIQRQDRSVENADEELCSLLVDISFRNLWSLYPAGITVMFGENQRRRYATLQRLWPAFDTQPCAQE